MANAPTVTAVVTRSGGKGAEVLVCERPPAGLSFPTASVVHGQDLAVTAVRAAARETGFADLALVADLGRAPQEPSWRLVQLRMANRTPEHWWVLIDDGHADCNLCFWLPVDEAARRAPPHTAAWLVQVRDAIAASGPGPDLLPPLFDDSLVAPGAEHVAWEGRWFLQRWLPGPADAQPERTQAFAVTASGDAVLVSTSGEDGVWGLPGGGIEPGERVLDALAREIGEEACARPVEAEQLGCYELVEPLSAAGPVPSFQAKFWARVELEPFVPRFEMRRRQLVPYREVPNVLTAWRQPAAAAFLAAGVAAEGRRRDAGAQRPG